MQNPNFREKLWLGGIFDAGSGCLITELTKKKNKKNWFYWRIAIKFQNFNEELLKKLQFYLGGNMTTDKTQLWITDRKLVKRAINLLSDSQLRYDELRDFAEEIKNYEKGLKEMQNVNRAKNNKRKK